MLIFPGRAADHFRMRLWRALLSLVTRRPLCHVVRTILPPSSDEGIAAREKWQYPTYTPTTLQEERWVMFVGDQCLGGLYFRGGGATRTRGAGC